MNIIRVDKVGGKTASFGLFMLKLIINVQSKGYTGSLAALNGRLYMHWAFKLHLFI